MVVIMARKNKINSIKYASKRWILVFLLGAGMMYHSTPSDYVSMPPEQIENRMALLQVESSAPAVPKASLVKESSRPGALRASLVHPALVLPKVSLGEESSLLDELDSTLEHSVPVEASLLKKSSLPDDLDSTLERPAPEGPKTTPKISFLEESSLPRVLHSTLKNRQECFVKIRQRQDRVYQPLLSSHEQTVLIDPAYHANVGDTMITLGEQSILSSREDALECFYIQATGAKIPPCSQSLPELAPGKSKLALWHGGGNWGDLWPAVHRKRVASLSFLVEHNFTIVGMPQSMHFTRNPESSTQPIYDALQKGYQKLQPPVDMETWFKTRVTFLWREYESFDMAQKLYPFVSNQIVPDSAFQLGPYFGPREVPPNLKVDILLLLRRDNETVIESEWRGKKGISQYLSKTYPESKITFSVVDWRNARTLFKNESHDDRYLNEASLKLMRMGRVVITDRLHASVLSYQLGMPIIYLDPVSGKITRTLRVALEDCPPDPYLVPAVNGSMHLALDQAVEWLKELPTSIE